MVPVNYDVIVALYQTASHIAGDAVLTLVTLGGGALRAAAHVAHTLVVTLP
ncbi:MAG: hypothetical protein AAF411_06580 [Myxococcota bacterium]